MADHEGSSVADSAKKGKTPRKTPGSARRGGEVVDGQLKRLEDKISRRDSKIELLKSQLVQVKKREVMLVQEVQRTRELAAESAAQTSNQFMKMKTSLAATHERERMLREQLDTLRSQAPSTCASSIAPSPDRLGFSPFAPPQTDLKVKKLEDQLAEEKHRRELAEQKLAERPDPAPIPSAPSAPTPPTRDEFLARIKESLSETIYPVIEQHAADPVDFEALIVSLAALLDRSSNASLPYPQCNHNNTTMVDNTELPEDKACPVPDVTPPTVPEHAPSTQMTPPVRAADSELYNEEPESLPVQSATDAQEVQPEATEEDGWGADALLEGLDDEPPVETANIPTEKTDQPAEGGEQVSEQPMEIIEQPMETEYAPAEHAEEGVAVQPEAGLEGADPETSPLGEFQVEAPVEEVGPDYTAYYHGDWVRLFDYNHDPPHPYFMNLVTQEASWEQPPEFNWEQAAVYEVPQMAVEEHTEGEGYAEVQGETAPVDHAAAEMGESGEQEEQEEQEPVIIGETGEEVEEVGVEETAKEVDEEKEVEGSGEQGGEEQLEGEGKGENEQQQEEQEEPEPVIPPVEEEERLEQEDVEEPEPVPQSPQDSPQDEAEEDLWPVDNARLSSLRDQIRELLPEEVTVEGFLGNYKVQYERQLLLQKSKEREFENEKPPREQSVENSNVPTFSQDFLSGNSKEMTLNFTFET